MAAHAAYQARSVTQLCQAVAAGEHPKFLFFWGHRPEADGSLGKGCLSQWWPVAFTAHGERFGSAEHYMMWRKAQLLGDELRARAVLSARTPAEAKALGRLITPFDESVWAAERFEIVVAASRAKFGQHPALGAFLAGTQRRVLVEASPRDRIWGIGLGASNPAATDPSAWRGLNLLGFALMQARGELADDPGATRHTDS